MRPGLSTSLQLIIGLGNPGEQYARTRHNAGVWFIQKLASHYHCALRLENKFRGFAASFSYNDRRLYLFQPITFMNHSGQAVKLMTDFYRIPSEAILVIHDELDILPGDIRLKFAGGHGGHNGLRDIIDHLQTPDFYRLRIGIGHPGDRNLVTNYVLSRAAKTEQDLIETGMIRALHITENLKYLFEGQNEKAMQLLHTSV